MTIKLGQEVEDRVTGFRGIAISKVIYLQGCERVAVQPRVKDDMSLPESKYFDEPDLIVISDGINRPASKRKRDDGGPHGHSLDHYGI